MAPPYCTDQTGRNRCMLVAVGYWIHKDGSSEYHCQGHLGPSDVAIAGPAPGTPPVGAPS